MKRKPNINLVVSILFVLALLISAMVWFLSYREDGSLVMVTVDGEFYGSYDLDTDTTVEIMVGDTITNVLVIEDGYAYMKEATCPDGLCIHQGRIHKDGQSIVCLPNRVVVTIDSDEAVEADVIAR